MKKVYPEICWIGVHLEEEEEEEEEEKEVLETRECRSNNWNEREVN